MANFRGPRAFPIVVGDDATVEQYGMTVLDWFAGQALPACIIKYAGNDEYDTDIITEAAYDIAHAMMARREEENR